MDSDVEKLLETLDFFHTQLKGLVKVNHYISFIKKIMWAKFVFMKSWFGHLIWMKQVYEGALIWTLKSKQTGIWRGIVITELLGIVADMIIQYSFDRKISFLICVANRVFPKLYKVGISGNYFFPFVSYVYIQCSHFVSLVENVT